MKIVLILLTPIFLFIGLNYRQLYASWSIQSETTRLRKVASTGPEEFQNPTPLEEHFGGMLLSDFWNFSIINGAGKVSNQSKWHAAEITIDPHLTIHHLRDLPFEYESAKAARPAAERYNNVTLIGGSGFRPTPSSDIVLKFSSKVSENFYGSAGVVVQPMGTIQQNGMFAKPFDMFGLGILGKESALNGVSGSLCYLALNWVPVQVNAIPTDAQTWHRYEIRLRWKSQTEWQGLLTVDDALQCEMTMPAFGPIEVHVWSDNFLITDQPRRWWEIAPAMDLKFQDSGEKQFELRSIQIFEEER